MNNLDLLRPSAVFHAVVEQGSFRAAADSLGLSPPYISQMVSDLEARLGRQLLYRSTRKIALTEAGPTGPSVHIWTLDRTYHERTAC